MLTKRILALKVRDGFHIDDKEKQRELQKPVSASQNANQAITADEIIEKVTQE